MEAGLLLEATQYREARTCHWLTLGNKSLYLTKPTATIITAPHAQAHERTRVKVQTTFKLNVLHSDNSVFEAAVPHYPQ